MIAIERQAPIDKQERLNNWIEKGQGENAVVVYGTSAEVVAQIINTGLILPYKGPLFERDKEIVNGGNLYYCLPLNGLSDLIDDKQQIDKASGYAITKTLEDDMGMPPNEVIMVAQSILSDADQYFSKDTMFDISNDTDWYSTKQISEMVRESRKRFGSNLDSRLKRALNRRGILIFYNEEFLGHDVSFGWEDPDELMVVADSPLEQRVIEGIKPLTRLDEEVLRSLI